MHPVAHRPAARAVLALGALLAAGETAAREDPERLSPVVQAVRSAAPAVARISTEEEIENPFHASFLRAFLGALFEPRPEAAGADAYLGSGVCVDARGRVLTNEHVVLRSTRLGVTFPGGRRLDAEVLGTDPASDLAVLQVETASALPAVPLGRSGDLLVGETVVVLGNPSGSGPSATTGIVSALGRSVKAGERLYADLIETDAEVRAENSGGPLLNVRGEVIGVATAIHGGSGRGGFAIPADRARKVVEDVLRFGEVRLAWLGVDVRSVREEVDPDGTPLPAGAAVRRTYPGSPAARAGIAAGDVITGIGGETIRGHEDFDRAVSRLRTGDGVAVRVARGGSISAIQLTAAAFPSALSEVYLEDQVGVELTDIPQALRAQSPHLPREGVILVRVRPRSPAAATGLEEGDVIRHVNNLPVRDMAALRAAIPRLVGRPSLLLRVARGSFTHYVTLDLS
jgi:serine protease Do